MIENNLAILEPVVPVIPRTNLMLHCGAFRVDRTAVLATPTPAATPTWQPLPHMRLLDSVERTLHSAGHQVLQAEHALTRDGLRYFGVLQVARVNAAADVTFVVGVRNSHDKSLPAGLVAGSQVFVCDNLAFNGQVSLHRKHTKFILDDLDPLVRDAIRGIENLWSQEEQRITAYKATELRRYQAHDLIIEALEAGVCSGAHVPRIVEQWHRPIHDAFAPRTVWSLHNAFTEALKGNLTALPTRTRRLQGLLDPVADFAPPVVVGQC